MNNNQREEQLLRLLSKPFPSSDLQVPLLVSALPPTRWHHFLFPAQPLHTSSGWWCSLCVEHTDPCTAIRSDPSNLSKPCSEGWLTRLSLLLQLEVAHFTSEIPGYLLLAYMSFYLSYGIKHFPPSTMIICTCYPRHYYLGEETVISLFSTTEPITMLGIEVVFNAPLLN